MPVDSIHEKESISSYRKFPDNLKENSNKHSARIEPMNRLLLLLVLFAPILAQAQVSRWVSNDCASGQGTGTYTWANGETYEGECLNERLSGQGTLYLV